MANRDANINRLARHIQSDANEIVYRSSSGYITPEKMESIKVYVKDLQEEIQELAELITTP